nr:MAG TPA: hypothetical protein [Caudoviricetes sp.]
MGNPQYIQDAVDNFEDLYGEELTEQQRQNLVEALEYRGISLGMDVDDATEALSVWGDYTGDMERALDSVADLKALLDGYMGGYDDLEDLEDFLANWYVESLGLSNSDLASYAAKFLDVERYQTHLETEGWVFASYTADLTTHVFVL